jgi:hypothetical protein
MQESTGSAKDFTALSYMLKYVYAPLETKRTDLRTNMEQLGKEIQEKIHKISQGTPINIPDIPNQDDHEIALNSEVCQRFESAMVQPSL